ncbi:MAG TPA: hypothetical protein VMI72_16370, partial [Roseiarcus sp.]|nr:hypothetical protein [Roseiarcus sp.]
SAIEDGIAVEIDLTPVRRLDEAAVVSGQKLRHPAVIFRDVVFDLTSHVAHRIFDLTGRGLERLPDGDQRMLALGRIRMLLVDNDVLVLGHREEEFDLEQTATAVSSLWPSDYRPATRDARAELLQALHLRSDFRTNLFRRLAMSKDDLNWGLHDPSAGELLSHVWRRSTGPSMTRINDASRSQAFGWPFSGTE